MPSAVEQTLKLENKRFAVIEHYTVKQMLCCQNAFGREMVPSRRMRLLRNGIWFICDERFKINKIGNGGRR